MDRPWDSAHVDLSGAVSGSFDASFDAVSSSAALPDGPLVAVFRDASGRYVLVSATTAAGRQQQPVVRVAPDGTSDYGGYTTDGRAVEVSSAGPDGISGTFACTALRANTGTGTLDASGTFSVGTGPSTSAPSPRGTPPTTSGSPSADACALIGLDELEAATGVSLPEGTLQSDGARQVCQWSGGGVSVWLYVEPTDPAVFASEKQTQGAPVEGVGDDAYSVAAPAQLYVLSGSTLISVLVTGTTPDPAGIEVQLVEDALARLGG